MTTKLIEVVPNKTYATEENAHKAVKKTLPAGILDSRLTLRYFITWTKEGRCFPVFVGHVAIECGVHMHFNVVG